MAELDIRARLAAFAALILSKKRAPREEEDFGEADIVGSRPASGVLEESGQTNGNRGGAETPVIPKAREGTDGNGLELSGGD